MTGEKKDASWEIKYKWFFLCNFVTDIDSTFVCSDHSLFSLFCGSQTGRACPSLQ